MSFQEKSPEKKLSFADDHDVSQCLKCVSWKRETCINVSSKRLEALKLRVMNYFVNERNVKTAQKASASTGFDDNSRGKANATCIRVLQA